MQCLNCQGAAGKAEINPSKSHRGSHRDGAHVSRSLFHWLGSQGCVRLLHFDADQEEDWVQKTGWPLGPP